LIAEDQDRSRDFYTKVLGAEVVIERDPEILWFHNSRTDKAIRVRHGPPRRSFVRSWQPRHDLVVCQAVLVD
jgi:catechol 2,3-dioxygenase-like lactoylglutathione lyase family enzyme